jgi:hypothetical protein
MGLFTGSIVILMLNSCPFSIIWEAGSRLTCAGEAAPTPMLDIFFSDRIDRIRFY